MEKEEDEEYQQFIVQMRKTSVNFQQLCDIPPAELTTLFTLKKLLLKKAFVIPSDIGKALRLSRPAVSRMLHNLQKKGYLTMKNREEDQRYVMVEFTEKGEELIRKQSEKCCRVLRKVEERMGTEDMQKLLYYYSEFCTILAEEIL
ncbi:MAG: winged helix DNA-binding protein [Lachnospiraceae bacterium]|nr:winged helix DNA-binding protein [Lachnospiraceae bacterium]MDY5498382.1 winged helix DNA-binding protein [Anaerobutyricum sp.]